MTSNELDSITKFEYLSGSELAPKVFLYNNVNTLTIEVQIIKKNSQGYIQLPLFTLKLFFPVPTNQYQDLGR